MNRLLNALLLVIVLWLPASCFAQWTEVQKNWNSTAGASPATTTVSLPSVAANHVVMASVMYLGTATGFTMAMTDGNGHSFTQTPASPCISSSGQKVWMFYFLNTPAASMTITATPSVAHGISVHAVEFAPVTGRATFDNDACANPSSGTTPINSPSLTPIRSGLLYAGAIPDPTTGTGQISGVGAGWTEASRGVIASDNNNSSDEYQFSATASTAVNWTVTTSGNSGWNSMLVSMTSVQIPSIVTKGNVKLKGNVKIK
jgi:hypothetical protein